MKSQSGSITLPPMEKHDDERRLLQFVFFFFNCNNICVCNIYPTPLFNFDLVHLLLKHQECIKSSFQYGPVNVKTFIHDIMVQLPATNHRNAAHSFNECSSSANVTDLCLYVHMETRMSKPPSKEE